MPAVLPDWMDSEDEELERAIETSLAEYQAPVRLVIQELGSSALLEGPGHTLFTHNIGLLEKQDYNIAGRIVALSIVHEGPGLQLLNGSLAKLMLGMEAPLDEFDLDELPNSKVKDILRQLMAIETMQDMDRFLTDHGDWLTDQGYVGRRMKVEEKKDVFKRLLKQTTIYMISAETVYAWEIFLQDIEDKEVAVTFELLLSFVTGADKIPSCGIDAKIELEFYSNDNNSSRLPYPSLCVLSLALPKGMTDRGGDVL